MSIKLKPCPFCGASDFDTSLTHVIACGNCGAQVFGGEDVAAEACWNKRATKPVSVSLEKLFKDAVNEHPYFRDAIGSDNLRILLAETLTAVGIKYA